MRSGQSPRDVPKAAMCGRSACHCDRRAVRHACAYRPKGSKKAVKPKWVSCSSQKYYPSYNISPQTNTPVLLSGCHAHIKKEMEGLKQEDMHERVIQTMKWGLVPSWHKGEPGTFPTLLNNCRSDGMMEKASFRTAIQRGQRCVVLADGFFEWDRKSSHKQPYFIYFADHTPTAEMKELADCREEEEEEEEEGVGEAQKTDTMAGGEENPSVSSRMLTMAGLFDVWRRGPNDEPLFTYTVITVDAHPKFSHIHHRMPAILDGDDAIRTWLDPSLSTREVAKLLEPSVVLKWHPVSTVVNNVRHKTPECIKEIDPSKQISSKQNTLLNWFSKSPKKQPKETSSSSEEVVVKKEEEGARLEEQEGIPLTKKLKQEPEP